MKESIGQKSYKSHENSKQTMVKGYITCNICINRYNTRVIGK